jgi:hypothetical protein
MSQGNFNQDLSSDHQPSKQMQRHNMKLNFPCPDECLPESSPKSNLASFGNDVPKKSGRFAQSPRPKSIEDSSLNEFD